MQCPVCGREVGADDTVCSNCQTSLEKVQILSSEERENFQGTTIEIGTSGSGRSSDDESGFYRDNNGQNQGANRSGRGRTPFPRVWILNSVLAGIIGMLFLAIIILFLVVFFSPIGVFILVILAITWLLRRLRL